jgi:hypothetical protein
MDAASQVAFWATGVVLALIGMVWIAAGRIWLARWRKREYDQARAALIAGATLTMQERSTLADPTEFCIIRMEADYTSWSDFSPSYTTWLGAISVFNPAVLGKSALAIAGLIGSRR